MLEILRSTPALEAKKNKERVNETREGGGQTSPPCRILQGRGGEEGLKEKKRKRARDGRKRVTLCWNFSSVLCEFLLLALGLRVAASRREARSERSLRCHATSPKFVMASRASLLLLLLSASSAATLGVASGGVARDALFTELDRLPVFVLANAGRQPLQYTRDGVDLALFYEDPRDAEAALVEAVDSYPTLGLRLQPTGLGGALRLALDGGRAVLLPGDGYRIVAQPRLSVRALCVSGARAGRGQPRCGQGAASDPR